MADINHLAVLAAALSAFALGGAWYSPALFGKTWLQETGVDEQAGHPGKIFGGSFVFALLAAYVFAMLLGPAPAFGSAVGKGLAVGIGLVASSFGVNYLFSQKSPRLWLIDGGYHAVQFLLYGVILGLWH